MVYLGMNHWCKITGLFIFLKFLQYGLVFLSPSQFDTSTQLFVKYCGSSSSHWWHKLLSWDSVFFVKNSLNKGPQYEHEWVFSMPWSYLIRSDNLDFIILKGVLLNNLLHYISIWLLYGLTLQTFPRSNYELAYKTALLFTFTSASGFIISIYSEPLSFTFTFFGMWLREWSLDYNIYGDLDIKISKWFTYILSSFCFVIAFVNRSNCILLGIYYLYDSYKLFHQKKILKVIAFPLTSGIFMFSSLIYLHYYLPSLKFCPLGHMWCENQINGFKMPIKSFYSFIQLKYWNIGFFNYWTIGNIPNFLIAIPNLIVIWYSSIYFSYQYPMENLKPLVIITKFFLILILFFAHVQIINRVSTFIPLHLWYISDRLLKTKTEAKKDDLLVKGYIYWLIYWVPLQTILLACFLPPA